MFNNEINFNTDKVIIIYFTPGAGGNYLAALLGLSDDSLLMTNTNVKDQLSNPFSVDKKLNILHNYLVDVKEWNDFGILPKKLFGNSYLIYYTDLLDVPAQMPFAPIVTDIVNSDKYFFICMHDPDLLKRMLSVWKNARVVAIINHNRFINTFRKGKISNTEIFYQFIGSLQKIYNWDVIKGSDYPEFQPMSADEWKILEHLYRQDFGDAFFDDQLEKFKYADFILKREKEYLNSLAGENRLYFWDAEHFFKDCDTIKNIKNLYTSLNIGPIDFNKIQDLHKKWLAVIPTIPYVK